ncbi:DEAD/DEAH box helicase [Streptomyces seoulensis]|uniref:DEAD/DEAH box helicase n=1 Tax=Streptomyces seoulensis TaxID=73044 RepID=UPI0004CD5B3B|nr:DEAD/DEAH box helicase [Streptomyces seoulensis]
MTVEAPTIAGTISKIQEALRDYIEATYHVGHPTVLDQRRELLEQEGVLFQAPYIESTPRYQTNRTFGDLELDEAVQDLFGSLSAATADLKPLLYDPPYTHQAEALEWTARDGRSLAVTTGTGSGKTESFLLPMLAKLVMEASHKPTSFKAPAVRSLILYPMNALVNDQLGRLRLLLSDPRVTAKFNAWAGRPARFARYTSRTLYPGVRKVQKDQTRLRSIEDFYINLIDLANDTSSPKHEESAALIKELESRGKWPAKPDLKAWYGKHGTRWKNNAGEFVRAVLRHEDPELLTRHEVLGEPPDVLITNYSMLEYMLMRPLERPVFDATRAWLANNPDEKFLLIIDEAHMYRGAAGAEVALLLRRLRARLGVPAERLQVICTSASFKSSEYARQFAAQLSGKSEADFKSVEGKLSLQESASTGSLQDAQALAAVPLKDFYEGDSDEARIAAVQGLLDYRAVTMTGSATVGELLHDALNTFGPMNLLVNETMKQAQPVNELGTLIFPTAQVELADRAVSALVALGSAARKSADGAGLLPCRVHAFFRGLPGLWACLDTNCPEVDRVAYPQPGPVGQLYAQPRATCNCGARVFELYTCRHCGSSYARAYTDDPADPAHLWHEPGGTFQSAYGSIPELHALDLLLEDPYEDNVEPADIDLVTGRLNPEKLGSRIRSVFIPRFRSGESVKDDDDNEAEANGEFNPCGVCGKSATFGRSSVQDHQTKGDQPFQALVTRQIEVQPPGRQPTTDFAPLRGRKVLAFSDSRQVAARLAPHLQNYSMRDVIRPLILRGWKELDTPPFDRALNLDRLYLAAMVGARKLSVRLRPELRPTESLQALENVTKAIDNGALDGNFGELMELFAITDPPPHSLMRTMYAALTHKYLGLTPLGLASLREPPAKSAELLAALPNIENIATSDDSKLALVRLWLMQWMNRGIWFSSMTDGDWWMTEGGVHPHSGKFQPLERWLNSRASKKQFNDDWLPVLLRHFCEGIGGKYRLSASKIYLDLREDWGYCERCRFTQRPFPGTSRCVSCCAPRVRVIDPETDSVFQARMGYYRASAARALRNPPELPMSIIAAEHTAQLNAAQSDAVFSKAEEHELLFQDVDLGLPGSGDQQKRAAIDVLSCTTTMEVGIDIGNLSGVALRNMPPSRANYQQRAGRAGRRGNAVATVLAFGSADTHDDHYFRQPDLMIRGEVDDPVLTMNNDEITRRHVIAYLLQRYHQDRLPAIEPDEQPQLFEVLGRVGDFTGSTSPLNRADLEVWLKTNEDHLREEVAAWLPDELSKESRQSLLAEITTRTLHEIDKALDLDSSGNSVTASERDTPTEGEEANRDELTEDLEEPDARRGQKNLLDRLLYKGVLPRYAFPTDVVAFYVFDIHRSTPFRPEFHYAPSQGLAVALSQYAPGKAVWIDSKEWSSGAIYAPVQDTRYQAWRDRLLYFECQVCHYAKHFSYQEAKRGETRPCPACRTEEAFGEAKNWMRPPGFAHPVKKDPGTSPDKAPARSYATRAKLMAPGPTEENAWQQVTERLAQTYRRETLLVTNTGPRNEGYTYCTSCGLIEPTATSSGVVHGTHKKPFPDEKEPNCPGARSTRGLVLGTDFISDVLLVRLKVESPLTLMPAYLSTHIALRTIAEALTIAATRKLDIEAAELQAEYRPALTPRGGEGLEAEIYLYDTLAGGAGFTRRVNDYGIEIFEQTLELLETCPANCDESCYRCLRSFRNRFEHNLLDRRVGAGLLRYLIDETPPALDAERLARSADKLYEDLTSREVDGVSFERNIEVDIKGVGTVVAPILARRGDQQWIFGVHSPLTPDVAPTDRLQDAKESDVQVRLIDDLVISRNLPFAAQLVQQALQ